MDSFLLVTQSLGCEQEKPQMEAVSTWKDKNFNRKSDCNIKKTMEIIKGMITMY